MKSESRSVVSSSLQPSPEYWSGQLFPSPGDLANPGIESMSPTLQADPLPAEPPGKPNRCIQIRSLGRKNHFQIVADLKINFAEHFLNYGAKIFSLALASWCFIHAASELCRRKMIFHIITSLLHPAIENRMLSLIGVQINTNWPSSNHLPT